jgi:hypothetical protein
MIDHSNGKRLIAEASVGLGNPRPTLQISATTSGIHSRNAAKVNSQGRKPLEQLPSQTKPHRGERKSPLAQ